ncbi:Cyclic di-GMP phosphodiesterase Gmr [Vibrio ruber DSM 16370]|uniref:cyclic-guanylate-specific phosphodiesterase n=1 Tax=Vibrio ruber (strain DSM 16370 / JCM 11486 / BCRC 17186 / CECT 7878 / LMG 23124 / VR1) TaxID=1123498 RepID=A0A1R4LS06_VIBR1|nr:EAL domain-containing protein [Vibrio ruber]SJN59169.1 Cyclic di-GMP phosphodiesterase Gmr [Vibrio ruber DSM 16370]
MSIVDYPTVKHQDQIILIIDDTPANLGVLVDELDGRHFQVLIAEDGEEGLQRADYVVPDLILLDVMMPGMNGFEVCTHLKQNDKTRHIPVIFMTALNDVTDKVTGFEVGGVDYITKPFQIEEVVSRIKLHLSLCDMQHRLTEKNQQLIEESQVRQKAQVKLNQILQEQQRLLEHSGVGIAFLQQRRIVRCNQKLATLFGQEIEALSDLPLEALYSAEYHDDYIHQAAYQSLVQQGEYVSDIRYQRSDGHCFWGETILTAIDREDLSKGEILVIHDIDQRKRTEALRIGQGQLFEMMVTGSSLDDILNRLIQLIEAHQVQTLGAIFLKSNDRLTLRTAPAMGDTFAAQYEELFPEGESVTESSSPNSESVMREQAVWCENPLEPTLGWETYGTLLNQFGIHACYTIPMVTSQGDILGTLTLYFLEKYQMSQVDMTFIEMATRIAGIAIERQQNEERIQYLAHHDTLTALPNRTLLDDRLNQGLLWAQRYERKVSVVLIDLDHFKMINDSLGHSCGDVLLQIIAKRMETCIRKTDTLARLGGDEFVILLYNADPIDLVLSRLKEAITQPIQIADHEIRMTSSIGFAHYPDDGQTADVLLRNADVAMYHAKEFGRNSFQHYSPDMGNEIQERMVLQENLRHALDNQEFVLHYQPQYCFHTQRIIGVEALLRWQHPEFGMVPPMRFIQLAETTGLIVPIGDWVLQTACKQNKAWQDAGIQDLCVAVNVSARQFHEKDLPERVAAALEMSGLEPQYLELEITESVVMQNPQEAVEIMQKINRMGVQLSIDDFGTGYSSLSALKNFPVHRLKIDRAFVTDLPDNPEGCSIAQAVIALGHNLGLNVIAEGVEDDRQLAFLHQHQCDEIQGYYLCRPEPVDRCEAFLRSRPHPLNLLD